MSVVEMLARKSGCWWPGVNDLWLREPAPWTSASLKLTAAAYALAMEAVA